MAWAAWQDTALVGVECLPPSCWQQVQRLPAAVRPGKKTEPVAAVAAVIVVDVVVVAAGPGSVQQRRLVQPGLVEQLEQLVGLTT